MQTRTLPDQIEEVRRKNKSMKVQSGNMFLKVRKQMLNKKVLDNTSRDEDWRCKTVCHEAI